MFSLLEFLFGLQDDKIGSTPNTDRIKGLEEKIQILENLVNSLQQKIIELEENQTLKIKKALSELLKRSQPSKIDQQGSYTLKNEQSPQSNNLLEDDSEVRNPTYQEKGMESKSETHTMTPKIDFKPLSKSQQYNIYSDQYKAQNGANFITLGNLSEQERVEIIQTGFQLQAQGTISLKKYYESTDPNSLFQFKEYQIKYETIRRTKLYQSLKEEK